MDTMLHLTIKEVPDPTEIEDGVWQASLDSILAQYGTVRKMERTTREYRYKAVVHTVHTGKLKVALKLDNTDHLPGKTFEINGYEYDISYINPVTGRLNTDVVPLQPDEENDPAPTNEENVPTTDLIDLVVKPTEQPTPTTNVVEKLRTLAAGVTVSDESIAEAVEKTRTADPDTIEPSQPKVISLVSSHNMASEEAISEQPDANPVAMETNGDEDRSNQGDGEFGMITPVHSSTLQDFSVLQHPSPEESSPKRKLTESCTNSKQVPGDRGQKIRKGNEVQDTPPPAHHDTDMRSESSEASDNESVGDGKLVIAEEESDPEE